MYLSVEASMQEINTFTMLPRRLAICHGILLTLILSVLVMVSGALQADTLPRPLQSWEYRWDDSTYDADSRPLWLQSDSTAWQSIDSPSNPPGRDGHEHL